MKAAVSREQSTTVRISDPEFSDTRTEVADTAVAYRLAGNNRSFDFIRHWDEVVFQACQDT